MRTPRTPDLRQSGFSLTELMVSVAVVAVVGTMGVNSYQAFVLNSRIASTKTTLNALKKAAMSLQFSERKRLMDVLTGSGCTSCDATDGSATWWATPMTTWERLGFPTAPLDGWGRPIILDLNEGEFNDCRQDEFYSYGPDGRYAGKPFAEAHVTLGDDLMAEVPRYSRTDACP